MAVSKRILFCPLDWGLGHATRVIPIIREFEKRGCTIFIASSGGSLQLLKLEFPTISFFELPAYDPRYADKGSLSMTMLRQLPAFRKAIRSEHQVLEKIVNENQIDLVISDNRYGCWSSKVKSVFITHQVNLLMPQGFAWMSPVINSFLHSCIRKFNEVWIPDNPKVMLTAPFENTTIPNQKYIGWLSRFTVLSQLTHPINLGTPTDSLLLAPGFRIIAIVSGPEPQRSLFEKLLLVQLMASGQKSLLVTGNPGQSYSKMEGDLRIVNHLSAADLQEAIRSSEIVVCRSGYSSVMDLIALGKNAIVVPTPQQPEQLFLAEYLKKHGIAFSVEQRAFDLNHALMKSKDYKGLGHYKNDPSLLSNAISSLLNQHQHVTT